MSVFGSRDDDPLLQGDPFAPSSSEDDLEDTDPDDTVDALDDADGPDRPLNGTSVFDDSDEYRVVRSVDEAANGHLDELNASLEGDWQLDRVELEMALSSRFLTFVLHRADHND